MSQRVLSFHYTLTDNDGQQLDSSKGQDPLIVLEGSQTIIPALEKELFQMNVGDTKKVALKAVEAYGEMNEDLKTKVNRNQLPTEDLQIGMQFQTEAENGQLIFTITGIEGDDVFLDGNHPLAGVDLTFDVEITEIREATEEELQHGHAHGPHGHHHH